jgi:hypothetical protein
MLPRLCRDGWQKASELYVIELAACLPYYDRVLRRRVMILSLAGAVLITAEESFVGASKQRTYHISDNAAPYDAERKGTRARKTNHQPTIVETVNAAKRPRRLLETK